MIGISFDLDDKPEKSHHNVINLHWYRVAIFHFVFT